MVIEETVERREELALAAFRMPKKLHRRAKAKAKAEDLTFSQLMRRAIRRELGRLGIGNGQ
jgi:predicted HicB family RNase H-like nuclease